MQKTSSQTTLRRSTSLSRLDKDYESAGISQEFAEELQIYRETTGLANILGNVHLGTSDELCDSQISCVTGTPAASLGSSPEGAESALSLKSASSFQQSGWDEMDDTPIQPVNPFLP